MPIFVLYAKAEMEGVTRLTFPYPTCQWKFDVQQSAGSETREGVVIDPEEEIELAETRNGTANFVSAVLQATFFAQHAVTTFAE